MKNTVDFRQFSDSMRESIANSAINDVKGGSSPKTVAEKYGTTLMTVHRWVKKSEGVTNIAFKPKGRPTDAPKGKHVKPNTINCRMLPKAVVEAVKASSVAKVKEGVDITKVAEDFGITKLTLTKWVDAANTVA